MLNAFLAIFSISLAYLTGSICSAIIVCRLFDLPDPRLHGSKNPGTTNVLRIAGKKFAAIVLITDMLKGMLPVLCIHLLGASTTITACSCLSAVIGHMYPIFFDFKGGKGVATAIGALLGFNFALGTMVVVSWLLIANFSHKASLASITALMLAPFYMLITIGNTNAFIPIMFISMLILYKHADNITRLLEGTETKISFRHHHNKSSPTHPERNSKADQVKPDDQS